MSVISTIRGLRKMRLADDEDGTAATPPPSPRNPQLISVAAVVEGLGGVDGLIAILREYWRSDQFVMVYKREWLERRNVPKDIVDLLMDLEEAICRGFLDDCRAIGMAVCRVQLLIGENMTLPLTPADKTRLAPLIRENEKDDWEHIRMMMGESRSRPVHYD